MSRRLSGMLVVAQIAPADSVYGRKLIPSAACTATGTSHQSDSRTERRAVRQVTDHAARQVTAPAHHSWSTKSSGPSSSQPVTAALTPPPVEVKTSAKS